MLPWVLAQRVAVSLTLCVRVIPGCRCASATRPQGKAAFLDIGALRALVPWLVPPSRAAGYTRAAMTTAAAVLLKLAEDSGTLEAAAQRACRAVVGHPLALNRNVTAAAVCLQTTWRPSLPRARCPTSSRTASSCCSASSTTSCSTTCSPAWRRERHTRGQRPRSAITAPSRGPVAVASPAHRRSGEVCTSGCARGRAGASLKGPRGEVWPLTPPAVAVGRTPATGSDAATEAAPTSLAPCTTAAPRVRRWSCWKPSWLYWRN